MLRGRTGRGSCIFKSKKNVKAQQGKPGRFLQEEPALYVEFQHPGWAVSQLCPALNCFPRENQGLGAALCALGCFGVVLCKGLP